MSTEKTVLHSLFKTAYTFLVISFAAAALWDGIARANAGGAEPPHLSVALLGVPACAIVIAWGRRLRKTGDAGSGDLGIVLFALAFEPVLWFLLGRLPELQFRLWLNLPFWAVLCIGIVFYDGRRGVWKRLLTMYLIKGVCTAGLSLGFFRAPWLFEENNTAVVARVFLMYPLFWLSYYHCIVLGYVWQHYERREKKRKQFLKEARKRGQDARESPPDPASKV